MYSLFFLFFPSLTDHLTMGRATNSAFSSSSSSSSIDSSYNLSLSRMNRDFSMDLQLGLSISTSQQVKSSNTREQRNHWPPIKPVFLRNTLASKGNYRRQPTFFVKVYMEGIPIGRKLDLFSHHSYDDLITTLSQMFRTTILCSDVDPVPIEKYDVLTYQDEEGDWMMVGDVPWKMFLTTVKRLKIIRAEKC